MRKYSGRSRRRAAPIFILAMTLVGMWWGMRFLNKPSQSVLGAAFAKDGKYSVTHEAKVPFLRHDESEAVGTLTIREVNGMVVLRFDLDRNDSGGPLSVTVYDGSCAAPGKKRYTIAPVKAGSPVGWVTLYDISWARLAGELPLTLILDETEVGETSALCADVRLD